jgi:iron complex outermembrane receptor protein
VGDPLPLSPKNKVSTTGTYALPLSENIGRIAMSATFTHTGSQAVNYSDATATTNPAVSSLGTLPPLNLLNLNLNWTSIAATHLDLALFASNVANKQYYTWVPGIYTLVGFETAELGQPRMYGLRVRYSW